MQPALALPGIRLPWQQLSTRLLLAVCIAVFAWGFFIGNMGLMGIAGVGLCALFKDVGVAAARQVHRLVARQGTPLPSQQRASSCPSTESADQSDFPPGEGIAESCTENTSQPRARLVASHDQPGLESQHESSTADLVHSMIAQGRYALLLRKETANHLQPTELAEVLAEMDQQMSVVPEGNVLVGQYAERATWGSSPVDQQSAGLVHTAGCYLDRFCVTNQQYQHFVDDCGYEQFQLWPEEALAALFEFVDRTGYPAPSQWAEGQYCQGTERLPVVGISWYEACAYARWVGKRLPTDAEWTKAGAWPVETSPGRVSQRRYPWGDTFESRRAVLWSSGARGPQPVDEFEAGSSLGGVMQLIGNVWEWTDSALDTTARDSSAASASHAMMVLHGGAYNTYFENQATCHFCSGEQPLARRANIGFRLALSFDVVADTEASLAESPPPALPPTDPS